MSRLTDLLESIDPTQTMDPLERALLEVLGQPEFRQVTMEDYGETQQCLALFVQWGRNAMLNAPKDAGQNLEINLEEAMRLLQSTYPHIHAIHAQAASGSDGGMQGVLRTLAERMLIEYSSRRISHRVSEYWDSMSNQQRFAAPDEYIELYRDSLPKDVTQGSGVRFRGYFDRALRDHPQMIRSLRARTNTAMG